jgi:hypothetical protein
VRRHLPHAAAWVVSVFLALALGYSLANTSSLKERSGDTSLAGRNRPPAFVLVVGDKRKEQFDATIMMDSLGNLYGKQGDFDDLSDLVSQVRSDDGQFFLQILVYLDTTAEAMFDGLERLSKAIAAHKANIDRAVIYICLSQPIESDVPGVDEPLQGNAPVSRFDG